MPPSTEDVYWSALSARGLQGLSEREVAVSLGIATKEVRRELEALRDELQEAPSGAQSVPKRPETADGGMRIRLLREPRKPC